MSEIQTQEMVTISIDRYNKLLEIEREVDSAKSRANYERAELARKVDSLYSLEYIPPRKIMYVRIDKLNLLGLLGLNFKKEDEINQVYFEFEDRGIFFDSDMGRRF